MSKNPFLRIRDGRSDFYSGITFKMRPRPPKTDKWYVKYRDANGILQRVPGFRDMTATQQRAAELERWAEGSGPESRDVEMGDGGD